MSESKTKTKKQPTYLVPFCVRTGALPHYVQPLAGRAMVPTHLGRSEVYTFGTSYGYAARGEVEWRAATPFEPPAGTEVVSWVRGRSAANLVLGGPVTGTEIVSPYYTREVRAMYYLTQAGVLDMMRAGAFDGVRLRDGVMLRPVKRGENYNVEFGGWKEDACRSSI